MATEPENFSHLTPEERLFVARNRLGRTSNLVIEVISLNEQKKAFTISEAGKVLMVAEFFDSKASSTLVMTIVNYEIVQLCRLWDKFDVHGFGLPSIAGLIKDRETMELIKLELRNTLVVPEIEKERVVAHTMGELHECVKEINRLDAGEELQRVRNFRDKKIAHPIYRTRLDQKGATMRKSRLRFRPKFGSRARIPPERMAARNETKGLAAPSACSETTTRTV